MTKTPLSCSILSAFGVVGPLAPSAKILHFDAVGVFRSNLIFGRARRQHVAFDFQKLFVSDLIGFLISFESFIVADNSKLREYSIRFRCKFRRRCRK
jgi:hypothetical protein